MSIRTIFETITNDELEAERFLFFLYLFIAELFSGTFSSELWQNSTKTKTMWRRLPATVIGTSLHQYSAANLHFASKMF